MEEPPFVLFRWREVEGEQAIGTFEPSVYVAMANRLITPLVQIYIRFIVLFIPRSSRPNHLVLLIHCYKPLFPVLHRSIR
ncbi:MAG: hypothetical protein RBG13Loki_3229 [Promethearchaeota archaeon CR_4]|nr:MAG: hypothetical protein RBG13Loki_3229 [Candidatus Lokiarchaeota archaeon CR_4]